MAVSCFDRLHSRTADRQALVFAFDLIELDGSDLKALPLIEAGRTAGKIERAGNQRPADSLRPATQRA